MYRGVSALERRFSNHSWLAAANKGMGAITYYRFVNTQHFQFIVGIVLYIASDRLIFRWLLNIFHLKATPEDCPWLAYQVKYRFSIAMR